MRTLHIQLLGDFRLIYGDEAITSVNTPRLQSLLAYLVLHRDASQARQRLAFLFWPDSTEAQAHTNLRNLYHHLRQALPGSDRFLQAEANTLQWRTDAPYTLDVIEFERALAQAATVQGWQRVVEFYVGDLVPNCYDDWILPERERLRQEFVEASRRLIVLLEEQHDYRAAVGYAQRLLRYDPLREETYRDLMRLSALSGDRAGVARFYNTCKTVLARELDVGPGPETDAVYEQFSRFVATRPAEGRAAPPEKRRHNLPLQLSSFIGRERERNEVRRLLASHRLVTLTGAGGVGKTRLALEVAADLLNDFAHGAWLIDLAPLSDPALLPQAVLSTLGVREASGRPLLDTLLGYMRARHLLLVLDNCEHLVEAAGNLAETLLHAAPDLRVLATSREVLGITGEIVWGVPALRVPDVQHPDSAIGAKDIASVLGTFESVQLFADRAAAALPTFALTNENARAVAQICHRLDGLPLAIELAAAQVKMLTVEQIAQRLNDAFHLLTRGSRTALPHHQTLNATIDWSYELLTPEERILFRRLSVFASGFALSAVETVCSGEGIEEQGILDILSHLTEKSLVEIYARGAEMRYRLLELVRQYAECKLLGAGEAERVHGQHFDYFLAMAEAAEPHLGKSERLDWLEQLESDYHNLREALRWALQAGKAEGVLRLVIVLAHFWRAHGRIREGRSWLERALQTARISEAPADLRAKLLRAAGFFAHEQGDYKVACTLLKESLTILRESGDRREQAHTLRVLGTNMHFQGDYAAARALSEESLGIFRELGSALDVATLLYDLGFLAVDRGDYQAARPLLEQSLAIQKMFGNKHGMAWALDILGALVRAARTSWSKVPPQHRGHLIVFLPLQHRGHL